MRLKKDSHIKISKLGLKWTAALIAATPQGGVEVEILDQRDRLSPLVDKALLNGSWDRQRRTSC